MKSQIGRRCRPRSKPLRPHALCQWVGLTLAAVSVLIVDGSAPSARAAEPEKVVVALPAIAMLFSPFFIADEGGFYKKRGLDVSTRLVVGPAAANAVLAGSADFSGGSGITALHAVAMGAPLIAIAETASQFQMTIVVTKKALAEMGVTQTSSFEARAKALKGRTIGVDAINGIPDGFLRYVLSKVSLDQDALKLTSMAPDAMLAALQSNTIDGISLNPPTTTQAVAAGDVVLVNNPAQEKQLSALNPFAYDMLLTSKSECAKRPGLCAAMIGALKDAEAFMAANPDKSIAMLRAKFPHLSQEVLRNAFEQNLTGDNLSLMVSNTSMEHAQNFSIAAGILNPSQKASSLAQVYTNAYNH